MKHHCYTPPQLLLITITTHCWDMLGMYLHIGLNESNSRHQKTCKSSFQVWKVKQTKQNQECSYLFTVTSVTSWWPSHTNMSAKRLDEASTSAIWAMAVLLGNFFKLAFAVFTELRVYSAELKSCRTGTCWQLLQKQWKTLKHAYKKELQTPERDIDSRVSVLYEAKQCFSTEEKGIQTVKDI